MNTIIAKVINVVPGLNSIGEPYVIFEVLYGKRKLSCVAYEKAEKIIIGKKLALRGHLCCSSYNIFFACEEVQPIAA